MRVIESDSTDYRARTIDNVKSSDVTIAFACRFDTSGEVLRRNAVRQEDLDIAVTKIFLLLDARHSFSAVRSGGQTGADEAGLKAGEFFGLDTECLAPKGYRMRMRTDGGGYAESFGRRAFMDRFVRMVHLESLWEVMRQMDYLPQDVQVALMRDLSVQYSGPLTVPGKGTVAVDALIELSENTSGKDRLWIGDDTFAEFYNSLPDAEELFGQARARQLTLSVEGMQLIYSAKVWEYMADGPNGTRTLVAANDESEAVGKIRARYRNAGNYEPENVYDVKPHAVMLPTGEKIPVSLFRDFDPSWMKETSGEFWGPRLADARRLMDMAERFNRPNGQSLSFYQGTIKPERNVVFVFGSNPEGRHGLGAAKVAAEQFGARYGVGEGLAGSSYALPTKDLRVKENNGYRSISVEDITRNISKMYMCAVAHPDKVFKVAYTHAPDKRSLNGYTGREMITMFLSAGKIPKNVQFSENWKDEMMNQLSHSKGIRR